MYANMGAGAGTGMGMPGSAAWHQMQMMQQ